MKEREQKQEQEQQPKEDEEKRLEDLETTDDSAAADVKAGKRASPLQQ